MTTGETMTVDQLLEAAALYVERAMAQLDTSFTVCGECELKHYNDVRQARNYEQLAGTPMKLRRIARNLLLDPDAVQAKTERRAFDEATKRASA
jgi:hypothetical protein